LPSHFITGAELDRAALTAILDRALALKQAPAASSALAGRSVALLFEQPSTRTRTSIEAGVFELGGNPLVLRAGELQLARGESVRDTALVLSRHVAAIGLRTGDDARLEELAGHATVPVFNLLSPSHHPCQALADLMTVREHRGGLSGLTLAYVGDGANNVAHSYLLAGALAGLHLRIGAPTGFRPEAEILARAERHAVVSGGSVRVTESATEAVAGADVVATDTWVSMGAESDGRDRSTPFAPYAVTADLLASAPGAIVLHCLPAHRGAEISAEVLDGPRAVIWDEAENRRHVQKALLAFLLDEENRTP